MSERTIKEFVFNALLAQDSFNALEKEGISVSCSDDFVPISRVIERDFSPRVWNDATKMSSVYTALYCIENTIRNFIVERMSERHGIDWWEKTVPKKIKDAVVDLKKKEEINTILTVQVTRSDIPCLGIWVKLSLQIGMIFLILCQIKRG